MRQRDKRDLMPLLTPLKYSKYQGLYLGFTELQDIPTRLDTKRYTVAFSPEQNAGETFYRLSLDSMRAYINTYWSEFAKDYRFCFLTKAMLQSEACHSDVFNDELSEILWDMEIDLL